MRKYKLSGSWNKRVIFLVMLAMMVTILMPTLVTAEGSIVKYLPRITTLLSCGNSGEVLVGSSITDQITLSWDSPEGIIPTGYIQLWQSSNPEATMWNWKDVRYLDGISSYSSEELSNRQAVFTTRPIQMITLGRYYFKSDYSPYSHDPNFYYCSSGSYDEMVSVYTLLKIKKTVNNGPFAGLPVLFEIRQGAAAVNDQFGTVIEQKYASTANNGEVNFDTKFFTPGVYQLCEQVPLGSVPDFVLGTYGVDWFKPGYSAMSESSVDNTFVAMNFTVNGDGSITFPNQTVQLGSRYIINNQGGQIPLTIGFWKNHCSVSGSSGGQQFILDQMLNIADQSGSPIIIGDLSLTSSSVADSYYLLDKSRINDGKKMASDPAFNLAAQLLAYKLNTVNNSRPDNVASSAADAAQSILDNINFNGVTWDTLGFSSTGISQIYTNMNYLARVLDSYNNDTLIISELNMPYPGIVGP